MKQKKYKLFSSIGLCLLAIVLQVNADNHNHDHDHSGHSHADHEEHELSAPNGGRIIKDVEPHLEFYVMENDKVRISFIDDDGHIIAPEQQTVSLIGGKRSAPTRLKFAKEGNSLVSDQQLPEGNNIPIVLQVKVTPESKRKLIKFNLNLNQCPTCEYLEYACVCEHGNSHKDDHHGHKH